MSSVRDGDPHRVDRGGLIGLSHHRGAVRAVAGPRGALQLPGGPDARNLDGHSVGLGAALVRNRSRTRFRVLTSSSNGLSTSTVSGAAVISSDGSLSSAATSPICVLTQAGDFWNPSCGSRSLSVQSRPRTSSPLLSPFLPPAGGAGRPAPEGAVSGSPGAG